MARQKPRRLPFRIPFFRIFYSTTYTILFILCLLLLAITPASLIWTAIQSQAFQYIVMIGGVYILTALLAIMIYSSRLYTNRTVLAGVGKAYIPIEKGEVGSSVRKMIVKQLERSAIVAWESRPRDLEGEILQAERQGMLPADTMSVRREDYIVGRIIPVDPAKPPWGYLQHPGWTSPSHRQDNKNPEVQFLDVLAELPNLLEARAVSLAPPDPNMTPVGGQAMADPAVVELLRRPETMGMRDYLTQLSYLGLVNPPELGQTFVRMYEHARFCGRPATEREFERLMARFSELLAGMPELSPAIIQQIRLQVNDGASGSEDSSLAASDAQTAPQIRMPSRSAGSRTVSPVTARTAPSRTATPYLQQDASSVESFSSVIHNVAHDPPGSIEAPFAASPASSDLISPSLTSIPSDAGSVVMHPVSGTG